jgi:prevent-host-death family protein
MTRVGMHEAKTNLSKLVAQAEAGEEVVIERRGKPVARLTAIAPVKRSRASIRGTWKGKVWMADDFDELPDDIAEAFEMR